MFFFFFCFFFVFFFCFFPFKLFVVDRFVSFFFFVFLHDHIIFLHSWQRSLLQVREGNNKYHENRSLVIFFLLLLLFPSLSSSSSSFSSSSSSLSYLNILCTYQYSVSQNCKKNNLDDMSLVPKGYLYCYRLHVDASYRIPKNAIFPFDFPPAGYICQTVSHTLSRMILDNALEDETHVSLILRIFINWRNS